MLSAKLSKLLTESLYEALFFLLLFHQNSYLSCNHIKKNNNKGGKQYGITDHQNKKLHQKGNL